MGLFFDHLQVAIGDRNELYGPLSEKEWQSDFFGTYEVLINDAVFKTTTGIDYTAGNPIKIPSTVEDANSAFYNCSQLEVIDELGVSLSSVGDFRNVFYGCTSLRQIGHKIDQDQFWHVMSLKIGASTVEGKVYDDEGNSVSISSTAITKSTLTLPNLIRCRLGDTYPERYH